MTYIRHRPRMVASSVFEDLKNTLIACRWMAGTTSKPVRNPDTGNLEVITVAETQTLRALEGNPIQLIDYFPDVDGTETGRLNLLAMDQGSPGETVPVEMGSSLEERPYTFNLAFYAVSDAAALALFSDLDDRYRGRIVEGAGIDLFNYLESASIPASRLEVDAFRWAQDDERAPSLVHLYFGELNLTDVLD